MAAIAPPHPSHKHSRAAPISISPSILRLAAWERLVAVAVLIVVLWIAVHWATS